MVAEDCPGEAEVRQGRVELGQGSHGGVGGGYGFPPQLRVPSITGLHLTQSSSGEMLSWGFSVEVRQWDRRPHPHLPPILHRPQRGCRS